MGRNLRKGKVEIVFNILKKFEDREIDKNKLIGELCWKLECARRTVLDYMQTAIVHGKLKIRWKK